MATIKTIKPAGGGDYSTLQAWEDFADDQTGADQWAECYDGDLGILLISGWTATPTASLYPKIYAASGNKHDGTNTAASGAYIVIDGGTRRGIDNEISYLRVEDIQFDITNQTLTSYGIYSDNDVDNSNNGRYLTVDSCLFRSAGTSTTTLRGIYYRDEDTAYPAGPVCIVKNCLFYGQDESNGSCIYIYLDSDTSMSSADTMYSEVYYCTGYQFGLYGVILKSEKNGSGVPTNDCIMTDNVMLGHDTADYGTSLVDGGLVNITRTYCVSEDVTADDEGGAGNLISKTPSNNWVAVATDHTPKAGGDIIDAGIAVSGIIIDALDTNRSTGFEDIGALQITTTTAQPAVQTILIL